MPAPVISVSHLGKSYGSTVAVDDVSLEIHKGEIFGLIGPNGAGKTTTMECVEEVCGRRTAERSRYSASIPDETSPRFNIGSGSSIRKPSSKSGSRSGRPSIFGPLSTHRWSTPKRSWINSVSRPSGTLGS